MSYNVETFEIPDQQARRRHLHLSAHHRNGSSKRQQRKDFQNSKSAWIFISHQHVKHLSNRPKTFTNSKSSGVRYPVSKKRMLPLPPETLMAVASGRQSSSWHTRRQSGGGGAAGQMDRVASEHSGRGRGRGGDGQTDGGRKYTSRCGDVSHHSAASGTRPAAPGGPAHDLS